MFGSVVAHGQRGMRQTFAHVETHARQIVDLPGRHSRSFWLWGAQAASPVRQRGRTRRGELGLSGNSPKRTCRKIGRRLLKVLRRDRKAKSAVT